jgi:hypothetical protein
MRLMDPVIASCNEQVLCRRGDALVLARRPPAPGPTWVFVSALLALILGVNGVVQAVLAATGGGHPVAAAVLLGLAAAAGAGLRAVLAARRRAAARPPVPELVFDPGAGVLRDANGRVIAALADVRLERRMQLASSSRALACAWPSGSRVIARGNPFGEGVDAIADALAPLVGPAAKRP